MNPYVMLGVSPNASEDEITKAYRSLAKKYHPDLHPGDEEAAKKMAEINAAYTQIKENKEHPNSSYTYDTYSGTQDEQTASIYVQIEQLLQNRQYFMALNLLQSIQERKGRWYYDTSICYANLGNISVAKQYIDIALQMEPSNPSYQRWKERLDSVETRPQANYQISVWPLIRSVVRFIFFMIVINFLFSVLTNGCGSIIGG